MADLIEEVAGGGTVPHRLEAALLADLRAALPQAENARATLTMRDGRALVAGLDGATCYGWLRIALLWIAPAARRSGLGRRLVERAERIAIGHGCHGVWLDTSNPPARAFYRALGFSEFGTLETPPGRGPEGQSPVVPLQGDRLGMTDPRAFREGLFRVAVAEAVEGVAWGLREGLAPVRHGYGWPTRSVEIAEAGHPVPDAAEIAATRS